MGKIYNVYLKDKTGDWDQWGEGDMYVVGLELKKIFDEVCGHADSPYSTSDYWWDPSNGTVKDTELLVYFLQSSGDSIIKRKYPKYNLGTGTAGNTVFFTDATPRISEVYVSVALQYADAHLLLAKLCFHELMHNKLEPTDLHGQAGGGGLATGAPITSSTMLTEKNKELMAKALDKKVPQYQGDL